MEQQQQESSSNPNLTHEQKLQSEVSKGCEQARQFEQKLHQIIGVPGCYTSLIADAASIISTFVSVITELTKAADPKAPATPSSSGLFLIPRPQLQLPHSPVSMPPTSSSSSAMLCSPIRGTPPHSPPTSSLAAAQMCSPHSSSSPAITPSTTPEGSPGAATNAPATLPASFSLEAPSATATAAREEPQGDHEMLGSDMRSNRKRKCMPKRVVRVAANSNEHGGETPPDDGFTWRKYGQKDILNSKFPRSYYRCTHQKELNCVATKYVQKCEEDPSMYQVTYIGEHGCQIQQQNPFSWKARPLPDHPFSSGAALSINNAGGLQFGPSLSSRLEDMKASRLSLSPSRQAATTTSGFNLLRPNAALNSPSQWMTPKFGVLACQIKAEPLSAPSLSATEQVIDQEKSFLKMALGTLSGGSSTRAAQSETSANPTTTSGTSTAGAAAEEQEHNQAAELLRDHELWNLEELPGLLDQKVVMDASGIAVSASLEHIPRTSITSDIAYIHQMMDDSEASFHDPMLFEPPEH